MGYRCKSMFAGLMALFVVVPLVSISQTEIFKDDFSGSLSKWQELGNAGTPLAKDGELQLPWGYAPNWFVTKDSFPFGSDAFQFDFTFIKGGHQATSNYKQNWIQPLLGATNPEKANGAVRARFSANYFVMERRALDAAGVATWVNIPFKNDTLSSVEPGMRVRFVIDNTAQQGEMFLNGQIFRKFTTTPVMEGGFGFRSVTDTRNVTVDDVYVSQIDSTGNETVVLNDNFNRSELGADWINETLAADTTAGPLSAVIQNGQLQITNDGSGDSWLRTKAQLTFKGKTTIFEYTFVGYLNGNTYRPSSLLGTKPFESAVTTGVLLVDNGSGFNYGMVDGSWAGSQAMQLGANRQGMQFKIVVDAGGQSGTVYRDGIQAMRFFNIGPAFTGGFAFRTIVNRDATIDDIRVYTLDPDGKETTLFSDNFNRDQIGNDWVTESITPEASPDSQFPVIFNNDDDSDNELVIDHDTTANDAWFRLKKDFPFSGPKPVVIEGTYVSYVDYASIVIGTSEWKANQNVGPILLDGLDSPWVMDTREGNVWVQPGPVGGSSISLKVNADGRSGDFLVNGVSIRKWEFAGTEQPIPVGAVGFEDPFTEPKLNTSPPAAADTYATAWYDNIRVVKYASTAIQDWMIQ